VKKSDDPIEMIKRIAKASLHKNRSLQVGGMLYCDRKTGRIIQILEGRRSVLKQLAAAIMMDTRHTRFMIIKNEPVPQRMFKDWGMSFANTLSSFQRNRLEQAPSTATGDVIMQLHLNLLNVLIFATICRKKIRTGTKQGG